MSVSNPIEVWNWFSFVVGVVAGVGIMWLLVVLDNVRHAEETDRRFRP